MSVDPYGGFRMPTVEKRYQRYVEDHHGDVTDLPNLCEVMWLAGAQDAIQASVEFADIGPNIERVQQKIRRIHDMLEVIRRRDGAVVS
jgi:hypothetical protein